MAKLGRPKKSAAEKVKNQIISIDKADYLVIKSYCIRNNLQIKQLISQFVADL